MTGYVKTADGKSWQLPVLLAWEVVYTSGSPSDSCWLRCLWEGANGADVSRWCRFEAWHDGKKVFTGVVDECEEILSRQGRYLELNCRGMAALLLDNEALAQDYGLATLEDILRDHVRPYGITVGKRDNLPGVPYFSVAYGSSEWTVLENFALYHGGVTPRFDVEGRLILTHWSDETVLTLGDGVPVTKLTCTDRRYGVLSEVWVRDRYAERVEKVGNSAFQAQGGRARRVVTTPGRDSSSSMRYTGAYQLKRSVQQRLRIVVEIPSLFYAVPGDLVQLRRSNWDRNGRYRVVQACVRMDEQGGRTQLELGPPGDTM